MSPMRYILLMEDLEDPNATHTETEIAVNPDAAIKQAQQRYPSNVIDIWESDEISSKL